MVVPTEAVRRLATRTRFGMVSTAKKHRAAAHDIRADQDGSRHGRQSGLAPLL
jgi:hypothetical protein